MNLQLSTREKRERERKLAEVVRESFLADLVTKRYDSLKLLCTVESYHLTDLRTATDVFRDARGRKRIGLGNLSTYIKALEGSGLVLKKDREIKVSSSAKKIIYAIMEAARPENELWWPQEEEVDLCLDTLNTGKTKEVLNAFTGELVAILYSGYWGEKLEKFFSEKLNDPKNHLREIGVLLRSQPRDPKGIEAFLKGRQEKIYELIKNPELGSSALGSFVNVNDGKEIIDKFESDLYGKKDLNGKLGALDVEKAVILLKAAEDYGRELNGKLGSELKVFLRKLLEHESKSVRSRALDLMHKITSAKKPKTPSQGRYMITEG